MIAHAHEMLAQEPWCFHPEQIASLTDWQIEFLYARPAVERSRRFDEDLKKQTPSEYHHPTVEMPKMDTTHNPGEPPEPGTPAFRDWVIAQFMAMGMDHKAAVEQYETQARQK